MTREIAKRIAGTMMKVFGRQKHFVLSLSSRANLEMVAGAFADEFGCLVFWNERKNRIAVTMPS